MANFSKIYITSTGLQSTVRFNDVPRTRVYYHPFTNIDITAFNTVEDYQQSQVFKDGLKFNWFIAKNEYGQDIDQFIDKLTDLMEETPVNGQVPVWNSVKGEFDFGFAGGGGSDSFIQHTLIAVTDITLSHGFGRPANVKVFESNQEIECNISYPIGFENSQVRIQSNQPITGFTIFT